MNAKKDRHDPLAWMAGENGGADVDPESDLPPDTANHARHEVLGWLEGDGAESSQPDSVGQCEGGNVKQEDAGEAIRLGDQLTMENAEELRTHLLSALGEHTSVRIDAKAVERVDAAGLQVLASLQKTVEARGGGLHWDGFSEEMLQALELSGMKSLLGLDTPTE